MDTMDSMDTSSPQGNMSDYYYSVSTDDDGQLPAPNLYAALDNPLKGLMGSPWFGTNYNYDAAIPSTLEWFYIGLDSIMFGDPDVVGIEAAFNWTELDSRLDQIASRHKHAVFTTVVHYPGWEGLQIPQYLIDAGLTLHDLGGDFLGSSVSPHYGDPLMLRCLEHYVTALGARYDADPRIGFIHLGLLGFWGEWHTFPHELVPLTSWESMVKWYDAAFNTTKLHARYPYQPAYDAGFGLSDGSFTVETLGGEYNGGVDYHFMFLTAVNNAGQGDLWRKAPIGGETRNSNQDKVFKPDYVPGYMAQSFMSCVNQTKATYILHNHAFEVIYTYEGEELANALEAHVGMGYNFVVSKVSAAVSANNATTVDIDVLLMQIGVAPFYYDLSLVLDCPDLVMPQLQDGVESIIAEGDFEVFTFLGVPASIDCLNNISLSLSSSYAYDERPVKFAQGIDGTTVILTIPMPNSNGTVTSPVNVTASDDEVNFDFGPGNGTVTTPDNETASDDSVENDFGPTNGTFVIPDNETASDDGINLDFGYGNSTAAAPANGTALDDSEKNDFGPANGTVTASNHSTVPLTVSNNGTVFAPYNDTVIARGNIGMGSNNGTVVDIAAVGDRPQSGLKIVFPLLFLVVTLAIAATIVSAWYRSRKNKPRRCKSLNHDSSLKEGPTNSTLHYSPNPSPILGKKVLSSACTKGFHAEPE